MKLRDGELGGAAAWLALAGLGVAAVSFVCGWRHGGPMRRRVTWSLGSALVAIAPVWTWAGMRVREHRHLDPTEASFRLYATALGEGGRFAFIAGYHELAPWIDASRSAEYGAPHAMVVDVTTGVWREEGNPGEIFRHHGHPWERATSRTLLLVENHRVVAVPIAGEFLDGFDGATGQRLTNEQWKPLLLGASGRDRVDRFESPCTVLPTGERAWVDEGAIVVEAAEGTRRSMPGTTTERWRTPLGHGFVGGDVEATYYDCTRQRSWRARAIGGEVKLIRAGGWVVMKTLPDSRSQVSLWHPETGALTPLEGLGPNDVISLHPDGRLFVLASAKKPTDRKPDVVPSPGSFALLDPETGARHELPLPPQLAATVFQSCFQGFTSSGDLLFLFMENRAVGDGPTQHFPEWLARYDPRTDELVALGPFGRCFPDVLGCPDRDSVVFVEDQRRLVRASFDGRPAEILFPR